MTKIWTICLGLFLYAGSLEDTKPPSMNWHFTYDNTQTVTQSEWSPWTNYSVKWKKLTVEWSLEE